jgi:malate permease and related proteins
LFATLISIVAPILIVAAIGYVWSKYGRNFDSALITQLVTLVGTPCLAASTLIKLPLDMSLLGEMAIVTLASFAAFALIGLVALKLMGLPNHSYLPALMFPNSGNMGLPLALFAFGETGLAFAIVFFAISATLQFTVGAGLASGSADPRRILKMPLIYAVFLSLGVLLLGIEVPRWVGNTLDLLGGLTIPLMLIALGVSLGQLKVTALPRNLLLSLLRIGGGFAVALGIAALFGLEGEARDYNIRRRDS